MAEEYSRGLLRVCIAQICQSLGWNSIHATPLELLTDVLERYLFQLGKVTHRYSEQFGRTDPRLEDVFLAFGHLGVHINELEDYLKHVDPLPFARDVVAFPTGKPNNLQFPHPECAEVQNREEHIPDHLPLMYPTQEEEAEEPGTKLPGSPLPEPSEDGAQQTNATEPGTSAGDKRSLTSPADAGIPAKRQRITTSTLPEEALHSQYEMKSVIMMNNGILSPVKQGKLPDSNTPPQIAKPKTIVTLDFSKDSTADKPNIIQVKSVKTESVAQDSEMGESQEKRDKKAEIARVLKVIKDVQVVKRGPGRPKSPGRSKVPKVIHSKGGVDFSSVTSVAKGADILSKEKIVVMPSRSQDQPLDMSKKGSSETRKHSMGSPPMPLTLDTVAKMRPDMSFEEKLQLLNQLQRYYMGKEIEKRHERDIDDTIDSVIKKSVREVDDRKSEFERLQAELSGETSSPMEKLYKAPHLQLMDSWRVSHISETYSPSREFLEKSGRDSPDVSDGYPSFYSSPWKRAGRPRGKPRGRPRGSGLLKGSPFGKDSSPAKYSSPYRRVGRPPLYLKGLSPRGRPRGRSPGRPRLSGGSPGRPRGSGSSPRGHSSPGRPRLSDYSPGHSPRPAGRPRGRPRGRSPRSRSPRGGSPRGAIVNINFDNRPVSPSGSDAELNDNDDNDMFKSDASPAYKPPYEEVEPESPVQENVSESPPRVTPPPERAPTPKVLTETISETPIPAEIITLPIKQEVIDESKETVSDRERQDSTSRQSSESRQSSVSRQDIRDACISLKKVEEEQEHRKMYIDARRRSSDEWRGKEGSVDKDDERKERKSVERKDKHMEDRKERHKEHSHSKDRERSKEHKKKKKKKDREKEKERKDRDKDREKKEKHKSKESKDEPSVQPLHKLTIKIGGTSTTTGSFSIKQEPKVHSPAPAESPKHRPEIPKLKFKVLPPKPGSTPEHGVSENKTDPTKQSWSSTTVQSESDKPPTPKHVSKSDPKPQTKAESIFTPIDETVKHKPSPTRVSNYQPLSPKFKPIPPAEPKHLDESVDDNDENNENDETVTNKEDGHVAEREVTVSVVGGRVMGGKSGGRGRKRRGSTKRTKTPKFASRPAGGSGLTDHTPVEDVTYTPMGVKEEKGEGHEKYDKPPILKRELEKEASPSPPTLFPVTNVPSPITIPALKAAPPPPSPPLTKKSPPKQKHLKESLPLSPLTREPGIKPKPPPVTLPKAGKIRSPRRSSPRKSPKQISPPVRKKFKSSTSPPLKKFSSTKISPTEDREFNPPRTPSPSRASSPSPSPDSPMYSPPLSPAHTSPLHFMIPPTPAFPTRTTSPPSSPPKPLPDLSPDDEDSSSTMPGGLAPMLPPSLPPMPPTASAKKAMQRTVVAETVGTFVSASGEKIWICPACTMQDDGSPMIGCDICDDWYHWPCVGITEEPDEDEQWYCPKCRPSKKHGKKPAKRGRKKGKKLNTS